MQKKGQKKEILEAELLKTLEKHGFLPEQIRALGSIDLKREEAGLLELADSLGVEFFDLFRRITSGNFGSQQFFGICKRSDRGRQCL